MDFNKPFVPFVLKTPMRIGQNAFTFRVVSFDEFKVRLTDPSCEEHPLIISQSDSDWIDWGDDFDMPQPLFSMMFGVEPEVGMVVVMHRRHPNE